MTRPLIPTVAPRLPAARGAYDQSAENEYTWVLYLYFSQLDNITQGLLGRQGGKYLNNPYGAFQNDATQAITLVNTPYVVVLGTTDYANGTSLASNRITVAQSGIYNVQFSLQFENTHTSIVNTWVWLRKNGVDVNGTASTWAVVSTHGGIHGYAIGACNFYLDMAAGDYLELVVAADDIGINLEAYVAATSPFTRPSVPSSVVTVSFVSTKPT
jgi:hypothetical protein